MRNPFTFRIESYVGALFVAALCGLLISTLYIMMRNFNADVEIINASYVHIRSVSNTQRQLIDDWLNENQIIIPEGKGYRFVIQKYPERPWLK